MSDIERLNAWMTKRGMNKHQMAKEMGLSYINVYHTLKARYEKTGRITGNFIVRFIATYGIEEANQIFSELTSVGALEATA